MKLYFSRVAYAIFLISSWSLFSCYNISDLNVNKKTLAQSAPSEVILPIETSSQKPLRRSTPTFSRLTSQAKVEGGVTIAPELRTIPTKRFSLNKRIIATLYVAPTSRPAVKKTKQGS